MKPETYDNPRTFPVSAEVLAAFRAEWRKLGPAHQVVDHWRFDLGWNIEPEVVRWYLEREVVAQFEIQP
jgi:hypothetical protein